MRMDTPSGVSSHSHFYQQFGKSYQAYPLRLGIVGAQQWLPKRENPMQTMTNGPLQRACRSQEYRVRRNELTNESRLLNKIVVIAYITWCSFVQAPSVLALPLHYQFINIGARWQRKAGNIINKQLSVKHSKWLPQLLSRPQLRPRQLHVSLSPQARTVMFLNMLAMPTTTTTHLLLLR